MTVSRNKQTYCYLLQPQVPPLPKERVMLMEQKQTMDIIPSLDSLDFMQGRVDTEGVQ